MYKKIIFVSLISTLLTSCISVAVNSETLTPRPPDFVTATLIPTKVGFVPATLTPMPTVTILPTPALTLASNCIRSAVLLRDVTVPDNTQMKPGEKFTKTWEFQNNGTCPWVNYTLNFVKGDQMAAPLSAPIPDTTSKEKLQVSVELTAPSSDGTFTGNFTLNDADGKELPIGGEKTFWVKIVVGTPAPQIVNTATTGNIISTPYIPSGSNSNCAYSQNAGYVSQLVSLINQARAAAQLPALTLNAQLNASAQAHSADMACNNFLDHTGSDGAWIGDRIKAAGYNTYSFAEIIAVGTPQNAMDQWAADAPHWEIVLNPNQLDFGVGFAYYANSQFGGYISVDFASH